MQLLRLLPPLPRPTHSPRTLTPSPTPADPVPVTDDTATHTPTPVITVDTTSRDTPPGGHAAPAGHIPPHGPTTAPGGRTRLHIEPTSQGSTSWRTSGWDTGKSQWSSPRWWNQSWGHPPQSHSTSHWGKHRHSTSNTGNWSSQDKRQSWPQQQPEQQPPHWPQQRQHAPCPLHPRRLSQPPLPALLLPNPPPSTPWMTLKTWIPLCRRQSPTQTPTTGGLIYGEASWTQPRLTQCEFPRLGSWGSWTRFQPWTSPEWNILRNLDPALLGTANHGHG